MTLTLPALAAPLAVTLALVLVYYGFMIRQAQVKFALAKAYADRGEKFDRYFGNDREMLAADRVVLNLTEHMTPFLALMWLTAVLVSPTRAAIAGAIYVAARLAYPFLLGSRLGRGIPMRIVLATGTGYLVLGYFVVELVVALVRS